MFHTETSLLPCDVDISHDDSVGCGTTFRILVADGCCIFATKKNVVYNFRPNEKGEFSIIPTLALFFYLPMGNLNRRSQHI